MRKESRVLIAVRDAEIAMRLRGELESLMATADHCVRDEDAIARLRDRAYAVVVLDLADPMIRAEDLLEAIAVLPRDQQPIIIGLGTSEAARQIDTELVQLVVKKPVPIAQLAELITTCVKELGRARMSLASGVRNADLTH